MDRSSQVPQLLQSRSPSKKMYRRRGLESGTLGMRFDSQPGLSFSMDVISTYLWYNDLSNSIVVDRENCASTYFDSTLSVSTFVG